MPNTVKKPSKLIAAFSAITMSVFLFAFAIVPATPSMVIAGGLA